MMYFAVLLTTVMFNGISVTHAFVASANQDEDIVRDAFCRVGSDSATCTARCIVQ